MFNEKSHGVLGSVAFGEVPMNSYEFRKVPN